VASLLRVNFINGPINNWNPKATGSRSREARGASPKKIDGPPRVLAMYRSQTYLPAGLFFLAFFVTYVFGRFSLRGEFKNTIKMFLQKVHVEKQIHFFWSMSVSVFPRLYFIFITVSGCFSAMGVKKTQQKIVSKTFYKKIYNCFNHVFGRFSMRGVQKHHKKYQKNKSDPGPFLASDLPTYPRGSPICFAAPWVYICSTQRLSYALPASVLGIAGPW
jgi:hypothetical protein